MYMVRAGWLDARSRLDRLCVMTRARQDWRVLSRDRGGWSLVGDPTSLGGWGTKQVTVRKSAEWERVVVIRQDEYLPDSTLIVSPRLFLFLFTPERAPGWGQVKSREIKYIILHTLEKRKMEKGKKEKKKFLDETRHTMRTFDEEADSWVCREKGGWKNTKRKGKKWSLRESED
jgi:hypothetical protein